MKNEAAVLFRMPFYSCVTECLDPCGGGLGLFVIWSTRGIPGRTSETAEHPAKRRGQTVRRGARSRFVPPAVPEQFRNLTLEIHVRKDCFPHRKRGARAEGAALASVLKQVRKTDRWDDWRGVRIVSNRRLRRGRVCWAIEWRSGPIGRWPCRRWQYVAWRLGG